METAIRHRVVAATPVQAAAEVVEAATGNQVSLLESSQFLPLGPVPIQRVAGPFFWGAG
jgi:hypothetical protein